MSFWNMGSLAFGAPAAPTIPLDDLTGPYLWYDTRLWSGGGVLPNLGSMGSYYNLNVSTAGSPSKQKAELNLSGLSPELDPWTALGGDPDTAGFTFVYANTANAGVLSTEYCECGIIFNRLTYGGLSPNNRFYLEGVADGSPGHGIFQYTDARAQFITGSGYPHMFWSPSGSSSVSGSVIVAAFDNITNYGQFWRNGTAVSSGWNDGTAGSIPAPTFRDLFIYLGHDDAITTSGKWATGVYAMALFRGLPSSTDISNLQTYFA